MDKEILMGMQGAFNNPADPKSWPYYLGFSIVIIILGLMVSFIWSLFVKNKSQNSIKMGKKNEDNEIKQYKDMASKSLEMGDENKRNKISQ
jgi:hypothetical protein